MLGMIAPAAGPPKASLTPIRKMIAPSTQKEMDSGSAKITMLPITARKPSATINTVLRGKRSAHTPPTGAKRTPATIRTPRIRPRTVALPPASRTEIARAIGNAVIATMVRTVESQRFL